MMLVCLHGGFFYGDIVYDMHRFNYVAQLRAPTTAHSATATDMLRARL